MRRRHNPFPGVATVEDRHGKRRYRLRRVIKGRNVDAYLPGPYGSPTFRAAYEEAVEGARVATRGAQPGTLAYLVTAYLESTAFRNLAEATKRAKRSRLDWIRGAIGQGRFATMEPRHVEALMAKKGGPNAANRLKKELSELYRFAAKRFGYAGRNPAALADGYKAPVGGHHTWTDEEIEVFRAAHPTGTKARLMLEIFLGTGAARQDAAALTRGNLRGDRLHYRRGKTGQEVDLPILPELAAELAQIPTRQLMLIGHGQDGRAYAVSALGNAFRDACAAASLPHCSAHGLRKAGARRLAEAGATEFQIMAFLAHRNTQEASRYTAAANRAELTTSGMAKLAQAGEKVVQPFRKLDNSRS